MNDLEKSIIDDYRRICQISMYPNVIGYIYFLGQDKEKTLALIKKIVIKKEDYNVVGEKQGNFPRAQ